MHLPNYVLVPVDLLLNKPPKKKLGGVMSSDLAGHVIYCDPLPIRLAGNCSSKNVPHHQI